MLALRSTDAVASKRWTPKNLGELKSCGGAICVFFSNGFYAAGMIWNRIISAHLVALQPFSLCSAKSYDPINPRADQGNELHGDQRGPWYLMIKYTTWQVNLSELDPLWPVSTPLKLRGFSKRGVFWLSICLDNWRISS